MYVEPHTHPVKPTLCRNEVDRDVLDLAVKIRDIIRNEELWYELQRYKNKVAERPIEQG